MLDMPDSFRHTASAFRIDHDSEKKDDIHNKQAEARTFCNGYHDVQLHISSHHGSHTHRQHGTLLVHARLRSSCLKHVRIGLS